MCSHSHWGRDSQACVHTGVIHISSSGDMSTAKVLTSYDRDKLTSPESSDSYVTRASVSQEPSMSNVFLKFCSPVLKTQKNEDKELYSVSSGGTPGSSEGERLGNGTRKTRLPPAWLDSRMGKDPTAVGVITDAKQVS